MVLKRDWKKQLTLVGYEQFLVSFIIILFRMSSFLSIFSMFKCYIKDTFITAFMFIHLLRVVTTTGNLF